MMKNTLFYVNLLKENKDKVNHTKKLIKKHPYINVYTSIYWKTNFDTAMYVLKKNNIKIKKKKWNKGELAIWATYINAYINFLTTNKKYKYFVLLEDDVILPKNFRYLLYKYYIKNGYVKKVGSARLGKHLVGSIYYRKYIKNILHFFRKRGIYKPIDLQLEKNKYLKKPSKKIVKYDKKIKSERKSSKSIYFK